MINKPLLDKKLLKRELKATKNVYKKDVKNKQNLIKVHHGCEPRKNAIPLEEDDLQSNFEYHQTSVKEKLVKVHIVESCLFCLPKTY